MTTTSRQCLPKVLAVTFLLASPTLLGKGRVPKPEFTDFQSPKKHVSSTKQVNDLSNRTIIVMVDNRSLKVNMTSDYIYWRWAAELNYHYSQRHGYDFEYIQSLSYDETSLPTEHIHDIKNDGKNSQSKTRAHCYLEVPSKNITVARGASWCKLLALASVLKRGYSNVVLVDSDMFFQLNAPTITSLIDKYRGPRTNSAEPIVWFTSDYPADATRPNAALQIWQTNHDKEAAWRLLRHWWQTDKSAQEHAYEQSALFKILKIEEKAKGTTNSSNLEQCRVGFLDLRTMDREQWHNPNYVVHLCSYDKRFREEVMKPPFEKIFNNKKSNSAGTQDNPPVYVLSVAESKQMQEILAEQENHIAC